MTSKAQDLSIKYKRVADLVPYSKNSRKHPNSQIKTLMQSIKNNGFTSVLVIDENNTVLSGHGRLEAAKRLCIDELPCKVVTGWTDAQKRQYVVSDNQIGLMSEWDNDLLTQELELIALDYNPIDLGFDDKFLSKLFDDTGGISIEKEIDEVFEGEIKVIFPEDKRIEIMNAIADAISDIKDAVIWCDKDEQV